MSLEAAFALDHVQLAMPAGGEEKAREFYVHILGFVETEKPEHLRARGGLWLQSGVTQLHLGVDKAFVPAKKAHPAFRTPEYDDLLRTFFERDISVSHDPDLFDGSRHCYVLDPFGNRIEFIDAPTSR